MGAVVGAGEAVRAFAILLQAFAAGGAAAAAPDHAADADDLAELEAPYLRHRRPSPGR